MIRATQISAIVSIVSGIVRRPFVPIMNERQPMAFGSAYLRRIFRGSFYSL